MLFFPLFDLPALFVSIVIPDLEGLSILISNIPLPLHDSSTLVLVHLFWNSNSNHCVLPLQMAEQRYEIVYA